MALSRQVPSKEILFPQRHRKIDLGAATLVLVY